MISGMIGAVKGRKVEHGFAVGLCEDVKAKEEKAILVVFLITMNNAKRNQNL